MGEGKEKGKGKEKEGMDVDEEDGEEEEEEEEKEEKGDRQVDESDYESESGDERFGVLPDWGEEDFASLGWENRICKKDRHRNDDDRPSNEDEYGYGLW